MKKSLRFAALIGIFGLTAWLGAAPKADAYYTCEYLHGRPCGSPGAERICQYEGTPYYGTCFCGASVWLC